MIPQPQPRRFDAAPPRRPRALREAVGRLGLGLFLVSLTVFFLAAAVAVLYGLRARGAGRGAVPAAWWWATAWLAGASVAAEAARRAVRSGRQRSLRRWSLLTFLFGLGFFAIQSLNGVRLVQAWAEVGRLRAFGVGLLVGLHAAHIAGLLAYTGWVVRSVRRRRVHWAAPMPVRHAAVCWHFLAAMWGLVLAIVAWAAGGTAVR